MRTFAAGVVSTLLALPLVLPAQEHVVAPTELRKEVRDASVKRTENAAKLRDFLNSDVARDAVRGARLNPVKIDKAIASLSDQELATLAAKSSDIRNDFAAGRLTSSQVTYIILGAILIIVVAIVA